MAAQTILVWSSCYEKGKAGWKYKLRHETTLTPSVLVFSPLLLLLEASEHAPRARSLIENDLAEAGELWL